MPVSERITERVRQLPEDAQAEVLDFVEFLLAKSKQAEDAHDKGEDPIARLGRDPVASGADDGAENHDTYLY